MSKSIQILKKIGQEIKAQRIKAGLTQIELAELCGFDNTYISMLERGQRNIPILTLIHISEKLEIKASDLIKNA